ncbi:MAG TPA: pirin family protein [Polyangiaceae bacterium]|nr:pirin family protein [Polyangiaceae bacterium]
MIVLRRSGDRLLERQGAQIRWLTFAPGHDADPLADGFFALQRLNELELRPGGHAPSDQHVYAEVVTYVREGTLRQEDSMGSTGLLHADNIQLRTARLDHYHREVNASRTASVHLFQLWLRLAAPGPGSAPEQRRFSAADRRGLLTLVAAPDLRRGSLHLHQDARIYSALLQRGRHVVHEVSPGRVAWLHVVDGELALGDLVLNAGDGAGLTDERAASVTARAACELLLVDLAESRPKIPTNGGAA